jgi:hypothetical protein
MDSLFTHYMGALGTDKACAFSVQTGFSQWVMSMESASKTLGLRLSRWERCAGMRDSGWVRDPSHDIRTDALESPDPVPGMSLMTVPLVEFTPLQKVVRVRGVTPEPTSSSPSGESIPNRGLCSAAMDGAQRTRSSVPESSADSRRRTLRS